MRIEHYPKDGKYINEKRVFWHWEFYHLPYYRKFRLTMPVFGGINFYY